VPEGRELAGAHQQRRVGARLLERVDLGLEPGQDATLRDLDLRAARQQGHQPVVVGARRQRRDLARRHPVERSPLDHAHVADDGPDVVRQAVGARRLADREQADGRAHRPSP
jgi:hypothetical protein